MADTKNSNLPITPGMSYSLSAEEREKLEKEANAGNAEASRRIFMFYELTVRNRVKAAEWLIKAAEQGSAVAQYNLAVGLSNQSDPEYNLEKAKYWALKAEENGSEMARKLLHEIELIEKKSQKE